MQIHYFNFLAPLWNKKGTTYKLGSIYPQSLFKENVTSPKFMFMPYLAIDLSLRWALDPKS